MKGFTLGRGLRRGRQHERRGTSGRREGQRSVERGVGLGDDPQEAIGHGGRDGRTDDGPECRRERRGRRQGDAPTEHHEPDDGDESPSSATDVC